MDRTIAQLEDELQILDAEIIRTEYKIKAQVNIIATAQGEIQRLNEDRQKKTIRICTLRDLIVIESGLPKEILQLLKRLKKLAREAKREDITVLKKKALESELADTKVQLRNSCPHPFVKSYDGYGGDPSDEYENARHGWRECAVCGFFETSKSTRQDIFTVIVDLENRLIKRDIRNERRGPKPEWENLEYQIEAFRRSAGCRNIHWPVVKDSKLTEMSDCFYNGMS